MITANIPSGPLFITIILLSVYAFSWFELPTRFIFEVSNWLTRSGTKDAEEAAKLTQNDIAASCSSSAIIKASGYTSDWWFGDHFFQLEQRAIFSQEWIYATHRSHFSRPGDYVTLKIAKFSFFLILGKDQVLRGFHNVCRHRAYEVTRKEHGSSTILGCRYHGWSYDTKGQLTKAPEFESVPGFEKKLNGLWEIRVEVNRQGLVYVNLDATKNIKSRTMKDELDLVAQDLNMTRSKRLAEWHYEGEFNWKTAITSSSSASGNSTVNILERIPDHKFRGPLELLGVFFKEKRQFHFQVDLMTTIYLCPAKAIWLIIKVVPQSTTKTVLEYELYSWISPQELLSLESSVQSLKNATVVDVDHIRDLQKAARKGNLPLHDTQIQQQNSIHELVLGHRRLERSSGTEIHPAARQVNLSGQGQEDVKLCRALEVAASKAKAGTNAPGACPASGGNLDW